MQKLREWWLNRYSLDELLEIGRMIGWTDKGAGAASTEHHRHARQRTRPSASGFNSRVSGTILNMNEAERLRALLDACHDVLPGLDGSDDRIAEAIRETCRVVEARLRELDPSFASHFAHPS
jgi:hypothetical protein